MRNAAAVVLVVLAVQTFSIAFSVYFASQIASVGPQQEHRDYDVCHRFATSACVLPASLCDRPPAL
jgi:hypothetical protein